MSYDAEIPGKENTITLDSCKDWSETRCFSSLPPDVPLYYENKEAAPEHCWVRLLLFTCGSNESFGKAGLWSSSSVSWLKSDYPMRMHLFGG